MAEQLPIEPPPRRTREIPVHIMGGPEDGRNRLFAIPVTKNKPRRVKVDDVEYALIDGVHRETDEDGAEPVDVTLAVHPRAVRLYVEPA